MNKSIKPAMDRVRNPRGRADWLAANLLKESIRRSGNPALAMAYDANRSEIEKLLTQVVGPRTSAGRKVKRTIETLRGVVGELRSC